MRARGATTSGCGIVDVSFAMLAEDRAPPRTGERERIAALVTHTVTDASAYRRLKLLNDLGLYEVEAAGVLK